MIVGKWIVKVSEAKRVTDRILVLKITVGKRMNIISI